MKKYHKKKFKILKASGQIEPFSKKKLLLSLEKTGLPLKECRNIANDVAENVSEGSPTKEIYDKTLSLIKRTSTLATVHYSLKKSLFDLGPEGHHFEEFVARFFARSGYQTQTCKILQGKYVKHEVDVIASKGGKKIYAECKFHNHAGRKNDVKISLYVKARWDDLKQGTESDNLSGFYVVSNTAFTLDAITYAKGTGLKLLGVNSPEEISFLDVIKKLKLYPVTSLRTLSRSIKKQLLARNILLADEVPKHIHLLEKLGLSSNQYYRLICEIESLQGRNK